MKNERINDDYYHSIYIDTCKVDYEGNVHTSLRKLTELIEPHHHYKIWCMQKKRNECMVDNSNYAIAVWDKSNGGTGNCVKYAKDKNKEITILNPKNLEVEYL